MKIQNYNLKVDNENIDSVILKLTKCANVEIRNIGRRTGMIQIKAKTLDTISSINEILTVERDTKFYINRIAIV
jgi:hypothetical protein